MRTYLRPILHWWWLIFLCALAAGASSYYSVNQMPPEYEARATLVVGTTIQDPNPTSGEYYLQQQLAAAYANIGSRQVAEPTMLALGLTSLPEYSVHPLSNSPLIEIVVSDTNPTRAQVVANELADQLVLQSPSSASPEEEARMTFINEQLNTLQTRIEQTQQDIVTTQQRLSESNNARQITDIQAQLTALDAKLTTLQTTYSNLLSSTQQGSVNQLQVLQYAPAPVNPVGPNRLLYVALATIVGVALAAIVAYLIELLDTRVKSGEEISRRLDVPVLGKIPSMGKRENATTFTLREPRAPVTDAYRSIRTNLDFLSVGAPLKTILVTGVQPEVGKSTVAANLAVVLAQAQRSVILVETDMRRPKLHTAFHADNTPGVSDICVGRTDLASSLIPLTQLLDYDPAQVHGSEQTTRAAFQFLPAGTLPPNPAELLASPRFEALLQEMRESADYVILDSPQMLLPDTATLLNKVDGVLLVFQPAVTRRQMVTRVKEQIARSGARILGIVLNRTGSPREYRGYEAAAPAPVMEDRTHQPSPPTVY